jgi:pyruvate/2-oxoglutarate dehydrogenase complex dihydrolipoamide dehydrogenase (E3) component
VPNVDGLGLDRANVNHHAVRGIDVDLTMRSSNPDIFAIGDVTGDYPLVHVAIYQGEIAARNAISGTNEEADYRIVTAHTIFSDPQIAAVGATEKALQKSGTPYVSGRYDFAEHGKSMCLDRTDGFVKMMANPVTGEILGAAVIGPQASELIHEVIVAMNYHATVEAFMRIPHLHPTLSEIWTYPAEECAARIGVKEPADQMVEVATSGSGK